MSWRTGSLLFLEIYPVIKQHLGEDKNNEEFLKSLVQLFLAHDIDPYDISDVDSELDDILKSIYGMPEEDSAEPTDEDNKIKFRSKNGGRITADLSIDGIEFFEKELGDGSHLLGSAYERMIENILLKNNSKYAEEVLLFLVSDTFNEFKSKATPVLCKHSGWNYLSTFIDNNYLELSEIPINSAVESLFSNGFSLDTYKYLSVIYKFKENMDIANTALSTLIVLLSKSGENSKYSKVNRYDDNFSCSTYVSNLQELIAWHINEFESDINKLPPPHFGKNIFYGYLKTAKNIRNLSFILNMGFDVNTTIGFTEMNFNHEMSTALMAASGHGNIKAVKLLIENGVDVNIQDGFGQTALDYALNKKKKKVIEYLENCNS